MSLSDKNTLSDFSDLVELLLYRAKNQADKKAFIFLEDGEVEGPYLTYESLDKKARAIGAMLQTCTQKGDRVLLLYQPGLDFISAFFGCLYAGVMAVPAYPPKVNRPMPRLQSIISDSNAAVVLTVESIYSGMEKRFDTAPDLKTMKWFVTDEIQEELENNWKNPEVNSETIAFLQYTSGSTGAPKGVMVSHGNLIHNQRMIKKAYNHTENTMYVSWLPLFHDMGLIGNVLQIVYLGTTCVTMAPAAFLQKPYRWLKAISDYKANTSGGPNFCYDLCVKTITPEQLETLDLSSWNVIYSGAEPVRSSTLDAFAKMFKKCGLRKEAFYPCYGLAEATLFVTGLLRKTPPVVINIDSSTLADNKIVEVEDENEDTQKFISCGHAWMDQEVVIADPEKLTECPENQVGEILISGGSVAKGYWNKKDETSYTFNAHLQDGRGPYLRTGDLGFLRQGELYITGRLKDLIIIRGRNHYPQDIEFTVEESHEALRQSGGAAFSVDVESEERLVIVHEVERHYRNKNVDDVLAAIRRNVAEKHELQVYSIALIMPGSILKTSSGKIQRRACKAAFLAGELNTVCTWQADLASVANSNSAEQAENADDTKSVILQMISSIIGIPAESIDENQPLANYGPDSLQVVELMHSIETKYGVKLSFNTFFDKTLADIINSIDMNNDTGGSTAADNTETSEYKAEDRPLSRGQKALWFMQQMEPENTVYNITRTVWIESVLDVQVLKHSFERLIQRHGALRTTFHNIDGEPVQRVNRDLKNFFAVEDASQWDENQLKEVILNEAKKPFDLENGPLFKVFIYSVSNNRHLMLISLHHIITDFWSLSIIMSEFSSLYNEEKNGLKAELKPINSDYIEYISRQEKMLEGPEGKRLWDYWSRQLAGELPVLNMPIDRPRPLVQTFNGSTVSFKIDGGTTDVLKDIARKNGATLYMVLLAAYEILLHRYTGQREVLVGSPTAGRDNVMFSDIAGYFVNPIVIKSKYSDELKFSDFLGSVRKTVLEAFENQQYPFATLVERLQPQREPGYSPVFQAMFAMQKAHKLNDKGLTPFALEIPGAEMQLGELLFRSAEMTPKSAQFELTATFAETDDGMTAILEYNTDLFDTSTIERLADNLKVLIEDISKNRDEEIARLKLITKAERQRVLSEWNSTNALYPEDSCIHQIFEEQVQKTPDRVAVVFQEEKLTYQELNSRANKLAHFLTKQGVKPGTLVGLCQNRSINMIVGLLGILKAGGTYIPLDPSYPADRLSYMLEDSKLSLLLTGTNLSGFAEGIPVKVVNMDTLDGEISLESTQNPENSVSKDNLAYIIYTSGSTGKPKGVQISHKALLNFIVSMQCEPGLSDADRLLSVTTLSFDIAGLEMYLPLSVGACLVIASRETVYDADALINEIERHDISVMQATPATWRMLLDAGWKGKKDLKILCGGEAMSKELGDQLLPRCGCLWNMYGPTETTIWSTIKKIEPDDARISIGRPINNTQIYILDNNMEPVPVGVTGEIFIGGDGLSAGYLNRPELTEERFVKNPFGGGTNPRMYRTGDLGRYLPDGNIEALGRIDNQVKIRGFRIELEEIEALLSKHPAVHEAVVAAKVVSNGDRKLIAYFTPEGNEIPDDLELRSMLKRDLPVYMIPSAFVKISSIPLTPNGKVDRLSLPIPETLSKQTEKRYIAPQSELERMIADIWGQVLQIDNVGTEDNFFDLGGHSLLLSKVHNILKKKIQKDITMVDMFKYPTVQALAGYLSSSEGQDKSNTKRSLKWKNNSEIKNRDIAIVGMSGRFPGAKSIDEFWDNLKNSVESVKFFTDDELKAAGVDDSMLNNPDYVKARAVVENADYFDASFFGFSPREAEILDPQHRLFLECAWEALEYSGYDPDRFDGKIGVFAGVGLNHYLLNMYSENGLIDSLGTYQTFIGNDKDFVPTRVSYKLNLKGPSVNVQTACSSSLVAIHLARQSLYSGECDMVLAGGVSVKTPQTEGYLYQKGGIPSPDGHCRAFDAKAQGTIFGNGIGIVVLKRLEDAIADGDSIQAVIKGTAINNDGSSKIGYTAPSVEGQTAVICEALENAGLPPETISYVEAHGTGTPLGDPIEIAALKEVFKDVKEKEHTKIGSVKTNIGHLDTAAGAAGIIKTVLALKHRQLPPSLHFETPNPELGLEDSPFCINHKFSDWEPGEAGSPLRAGVSAFGIGGTNAHIILEEAPTMTKSGQVRPWKLLVISARTQTALDTLSQNFINYLKQNPETELADAAYTLQMGRKPMSCRRIAVCRDSEDAAAVLEALEPQRVYTGNTKTKKPAITFMFPGQGSQYVNMAHDLYQNEPVFKETVDKCCTILKPVLGLDLRDLIYPKAAENDTQSEKLQQTQITQPVLFVIEYAAAKLFMSLGIQPASMIGHSIGEYAAACISGVFSLEDALTLVAARGKLMQSCQAGSMMAVSLSEDKVIPYLGENVSVAAVNSPALCVVSGPNEAVIALEQKLSGDGIVCRHLHTSHAFHSYMMNPILEDFRKTVERVKMNTPGIPFVSNITGDWISDSDATDPDYWVRHLRSAVRFADGVKKLIEQPDCVLLEVGPGQALCTLARQQARQDKVLAILSSIRHPKETSNDSAYFLNTVGRLWLTGAEPDWMKYYANEERHRIPLPTYPFERQRYFIEVDKKKSDSSKKSLTKVSNVTDWFYMPSWKKTMSPVKMAESVGKSWLVFRDSEKINEYMEGLLKAENLQLVSVEKGDGFNKVSDFKYSVNPGKKEDYVSLIEALKEEDRLPDTIVHLWSCSSEGLPGSACTLENELDTGFYSLMYTAQAIGKYHSGNDIRIEVVTKGMHKVESRDVINPGKAALAGPLKVIPQEYPGITCRCIDLGAADILDEDMAEQLVAELLTGSDNQMIAYRGMERWVQEYEAVKINEGTGIPDSLCEKGVYLITGGTGGVGLEIAGYLVEKVKARLILVCRSEFPKKEKWEQWLSEHEENNSVSLKIRKMQEIEKLGGEVSVMTGDVAKVEDMKACVGYAVKTYGGLNGVIHAAGVPGGGIIQLKTQETAAKVLLPKVQGVLALSAALEGINLDLFVLCSSINSVIGGFGQMDYTAANAYLDAFSQSRASRKGTRYISINWDRWKDVGMAAGSAGSAAGAQGGGTMNTTPVNHPLLDQCIVETLNKDVYSTRFQVRKHWVLSEHTIAGRPTIPGTTYLEMVRAAFEKHADGKNIEISETAFMAPLVVEGDETRETLTLLNEKDGFYEFKVMSRLVSEEGKTLPWQVHAAGKIRSCEVEPAAQFDIATLVSKCNKKEIEVSKEDMGAEKLSFVGTGPRWNNLKKVYIGEDEALTVLELSAEFSGDLESMKLHPAVMDVATGFVQRFVGDGNYLPLAYEKLSVKDKMVGRMYGYARFKDKGLQNQKDTITCDISILDEKGKELIDITGFTMKRVNKDTSVSLNSAFTKGEYEEVETYGLAAAADPLFGMLTAKAPWSQGDGLSVKEAMDVFDRILSGCSVPQIIVSARQLDAVIENINSLNREKIADEMDSANFSQPVHARPSVNSVFIAPENELEQTIGSIWQKVLGIDQIGINDNFFELGGSSLTGIQVVAELKKALGVDLPTVSIFEAPTVSLLAKLLSPEKNQKSFEHTRNRADKKREALNRKRSEAKEKRR